MAAVGSGNHDETGLIVKELFMKFLQEFQIVDVNSSSNGHIDTSIGDDGNDNQQSLLLVDYMMQLNYMMQNNKSTVYVDFQHVLTYNHELAEAIEIEYYRYETYLRAAIEDILKADNVHYVFDVDKGKRYFFVAFYNLPRCYHIRNAMRTENIGHLLSVSGTVTRSSEVRPELLYGAFTCIACGHDMDAKEQQYYYSHPQVCVGCGSLKKEMFHLNIDKSAFVDWQRLRVQENADEIPPGSMPRCIDVICRNEIVEMAKAGDKIIFTGSVAVIPSSSGLARAGESTVKSKSGGRAENGEGITGLKAYGVSEMTYKMMFVASSVQHADHRAGKPTARNLSIVELGGGVGGGAGGSESDKDDLIELTDQEKQEIFQLRNTPHLYNKMVESICPSVFGHQEVKRGVLLMLFGGVHKKTKEGISLRGDLNVCIVGDPSCAKSQFLKYVHGFLPRTVYTSGKSSSAAGLTASVVRDAESGEYCVEAGALMLADNGICCIDEFDKMDPGDQVAIHEAMEQQTISITKAGIQATLNARTSILAAANPVFGRYDRTKTLKANVAISAPIMSRFDLFFVILDESNPVIDESIARHIISMHRCGGKQKVARDVPFTAEQIQRYIRWARTLNPKHTQESKKILVECYRLLRQNDILGKNKTAYRITVRQLESLVRLSEALARLHLDENVQPGYVKEAYRLLQKSIIFVETEDIDLEDNEQEMNNYVIERNRGINDGDSGGDGGDGGTGSGGGEGDGGSDGGSGSGGGNDNSNTDDISNNNNADGNSRKKSRDVHDDDNAVGKQQQPVKKKQKLQMNAKAYDDASSLLILGLKQMEDDRNNNSSSSDIGKGVVWKDLLKWYLEQFQDEYISEEVYEDRRKMTNLIIKRMIKHEGRIMEIERTDYDGVIEQEDKILKLHPSADI